jgi:Na+-driven multidrug efflux pump
LGKDDVVGARIAADRSLQWGVGAGVVVGTVVFFAAPSLPLLFTNDAEIAADAVMPIRILALLQPLNSAVFVGDGVFQGSADFDYLAKAMAFSSAIGILALTAGGAIEGATLTNVWFGMAALMMGRAATLGWRYFKDEESPLVLTPMECACYYGDDPDDEYDP